VWPSIVLQLITISTMNWQSFSELAFGFTLTLSIALYTLGFAVAMGLVGGLFRVEAAQLPVVDSLRAD